MTPMRNTFFLLLFTTLTALQLAAQPGIMFQIRNAERIGTTYEFDVYAKGDSNTTFHNRGQVYINYNTAAFGDSVVARNNACFPTSLALLNELSIVGNKYVTINFVDNSAGRFSATWESNFSGVPPLPAAHTELPLKWTPLYHFCLDMQDTTASPSLSFDYQLMQNQQFYLFAANDERNYRLLRPGSDFIKSVYGRVTWDQNGDSLPSPGEPGLAHWLVEAQPGPYYTLTDSQGFYRLQVDTGQYQVRALPPIGQSPSQAFPNSRSLSLSSQSIEPLDYDFAVQLDSCPLLEVRAFGFDHLHCDTGSFWIQYINRSAVPASNVVVHLELPEDASILGASSPFAINPQKGYDFPLGTLPPQHAGAIRVIDSLGCNPDRLGQAYTLSTHISPENFCPQRDTAWSGAFLEARSFCQPGTDEVFFVFENTGTAPMPTFSSYQIFANDTLIFTDTVQLAPGDSLRLKVHARGAALSLFAQQSIDHPDQGWFRINEAGCGASIGFPFQKGYLTDFPGADPNELDQDVLLLNIVATQQEVVWQAQPNGWQSQHFISDSTEIRTGIEFPNFMSMSAAEWMVLDSLPLSVDPRSLRPGPLPAGSRLDVYGKGSLVLDFYGNDLSAGGRIPLFFRARPYRRQANGTLIRQAIGACADTALALMSDSLFHTIASQPIRSIQNNRVVLNPPNSGLTLHQSLPFRLYPNPTPDKLFLELNRSHSLTGGELQLHLYDPTGKQLWERDLSGGQRRVELDVSSLPTGLYLLQLQGREGRWSRKFVKK
jgi:hypothetical protein